MADPDWKVLDDAKRAVCTAAWPVLAWDSAKAEAWLPGLQAALRALDDLKPWQSSETLAAPRSLCGAGARRGLRDGCHAR